MRHPELVTCCMLIWGLAGSHATPAADWTEFRGPTGQGHSSAKGLPLSWSPTRNVSWSTPIPGLGWSSPVVSEGLVFLTTAVPINAEDGESAPDRGAQSLRTLCVESVSGRMRWDLEVFRQDAAAGKGVHSKNSHASPTPVADGEHVYVHFGAHGTACLTTKGEVVWKHQELKYKPIHGNGGSPILFEDLLIVICDGGDVSFVAGLDRATGEMRWKTDRDVNARKLFSFSTPLLIDVDGQPQIVCPGSGIVAAYEPSTGREIWRVEYPGGYSVIPRPVFGHGLVYVCTGYDSPTLLAIRPDGRGDITQTHVAWSSADSGWKARGAVPHTPSLLLVGSELYFVSDKGIASCIDAVSGKAHWQERLGGNFSASPLLAEGRIYFQSEQGETIVIRASPQFEELSRSTLEERTLASPAVIGSALLLRTRARLVRIEQH